MLTDYNEAFDTHHHAVQASAQVRRLENVIITDILDQVQTLSKSARTELIKTIIDLL